MMMTSRDICRVISAVLATVLLIFADGQAAHAAGAPERARIVSLVPVEVFSRTDIDKANRLQALSGVAACGVRVFEMIYESIGIHGEPAALSAAIYVPDGCPGPYPLLGGAHGTQSDRAYSSTQVGPGNANVTFFAAHGYVVVAPDYLGLGKSTYPFHPYLHADSEASAIIDALIAAQQTGDRLGIEYSGKVMLFGYSQGGHAAMATQREIERHYRSQINLVASAPMAGPYALSQTFLDGWFGRTNGQDNSLVSELVSYTIVSYQRIYGDLYKVPAEVFRPPFAAHVERLFPGSLGLFEIRRSGLLPDVRRLVELRQTDFTIDFFLNPGNRFRRALERNDLLDWVPATPMILCGSSGDSIVDFANARTAQAAFATGGVFVPIIDIADAVPANASGQEHHVKFGAPLCFSRIRAALFDRAR